MCIFQSGWLLSDWMTLLCSTRFKIVWCNVDIAARIVYEISPCRLAYSCCDYISRALRAERERWKFPLTAHTFFYNPAPLLFPLPLRSHALYVSAFPQRLPLHALNIWNSTDMQATFYGCEVSKCINISARGVLRGACAWPPFGMRKFFRRFY